MPAIGLINGEIVDLSQPVISMEDRGYQFGDGVYEQTRVYNGVCFEFERHMERLHRSLRELRIPATYTTAELYEFHQTLIKESGIRSGAIYMQISRGVSPRQHNFPTHTVPVLTMAIKPAGTANDQLKRDGANSIIIPDERWHRCDIKSLNLLYNVMGKQQAKEANCFEAVMVRDGAVTEGTSSNFFIVKDGIVWTHPADHFILRGITRTVLLEEVAKELDITVLEKTFSPDFAKKADEAFLSGTMTEVMPIVAIDGLPVGDGKVGPVTKKIFDAFEQRIKIQCGLK